MFKNDLNYFGILWFCNWNENYYFFVYVFGVIDKNYVVKNCLICLYDWNLLVYFFYLVWVVIKLNIFFVNCYFCIKYFYF